MVLVQVCTALCTIKYFFSFHSLTLSQQAIKDFTITQSHVMYKSMYTMQTSFLII